MKLLITIPLFIMLISCTSKANYPDEVMYDIASILKDVSQSVDGELKFGETTGLTQKKIIDMALSNSQLDEISDLVKRANIAEYKMISEFQDDNAVMLICDGNMALMEDAGCNAAFDRVYWKSPKVNTCEIRIDASKICAN